MDLGNLSPDGVRPVVVRIPVEPVEAAMEADALDAVHSAGEVAVRGPLFGVVAQTAEDGQRWRAVTSITAPFPQISRGTTAGSTGCRARSAGREP